MMDPVMALLERSASPLDAAAGHAEYVYSVAEGATSPPGIEEVSSSWQRSANKYRVDPVDTHAPRILTSGELKDFRGPLDKLIFSAQEEIDQLYKVVREAGYTVLFCDSSGVAVEHRGEDTQASRFEYWGTWLGGVWSEEVEGTNGIGTCIIEQRPVTVHRGQHFRSRHINLSCSGAPLFGVDGRLMAVLDVSAIDPELSERAHALTGALTVRSAHAIEERFFRAHFRREWIVAVAPPEGGVVGMLLAVDGNQHLSSERVIGYEAGYRTLITGSLYLDLAIFHNEYNDLISLGAPAVTLDPTPTPPHLTIHLPYANGLRGSTDGFEIAPDWKPARWWQMKATYSYLNLKLERIPGVVDGVGYVSKDEGSSPHNQVTLQSRFNLPKGLEFDQTYRYVSALPAQLVGSYSTADTRLAWQATRQVEFSVVGENLFQPHHAEFGGDPGPLVGIKRSVYAQITWRHPAD